MSLPRGTRDDPLSCVWLVAGDRGRYDRVPSGGSLELRPSAGAAFARGARRTHRRVRRRVTAPAPLRRAVHERRRAPRRRAEGSGPAAARAGCAPRGGSRAALHRHRGAARPTVGAGRERDRRPRAGHVALDARQRRRADATRRCQGRRAGVPRPRSRQAPGRARHLLGRRERRRRPHARSRPPPPVGRGDHALAGGGRDSHRRRPRACRRAGPGRVLGARRNGARAARKRGKRRGHDPLPLRRPPEPRLAAAGRGSVDCRRGRNPRLHRRARNRSTRRVAFRVGTGTAPPGSAACPTGRP